MKISVIIPTFNEINNINPLLNSILSNEDNFITEILIIDSPLSTDGLSTLKFPDKIKYYQSIKTGRANQMNFGASLANGDILYFVHADVLLPLKFDLQIVNSINNGFNLGCFRYKFNSQNPLLKINGFFTRFPFIWCRGGDQTLFIEKNSFKAIGGFDSKYVIMEDYDIILRAKKNNLRFEILKENILVSDRKYQNRNYFKVQWANLIAMRMFMSKKHSSEEIKNKYYENLKILN
jgi:rSAM/selenodomain-associated transferase 2